MVLFSPSNCSTQHPNSLSLFCCLHFHCRDAIVALKARGSGWDVKLFRSPGDRTEQFILPGLIVQDFAASLQKKVQLVTGFPLTILGFGGKSQSFPWWKTPIFPSVQSQLFSQRQVFSRKWMEIDRPSGKPASAAPCHHGSSTGEAAAALPCSLSISSGICELQAGASTSSMIHVFGQRTRKAPVQL